MSTHLFFVYLDGLDVLCLKAFWTFCHIKLYSLTFLQAAESADAVPGTFRLASCHVGRERVAVQCFPSSGQSCFSGSSSVGKALVPAVTVQNGSPPPHTVMACDNAFANLGA
jgi:hypothetical protein